MYRGRSELEWQPISALCALIANIYRDPKKTKTFIPSDFNPWNEKKRSLSKTRYPINKQTISLLKVFVKDVA